VTTEDGSLSCRDPETGELYHNRAGAYREALENYVEPSRASRILREHSRLAILDACFGLGYNTLVLLEQILADPLSQGNISVLALDIDLKILNLVGRILDDQRLALTARALAAHVSLVPGKRKLTVRPGLTLSLEICQEDLRHKLPALNQQFDLVFHDPFSPAKVPELWTADLFRNYYRLLSQNKGKLLTYSSAAAVRGGLREAGFEVWRTIAVGGKSGGTMAVIPGCQVEEAWAFPLTDSEVKKIMSASGIAYRDPTLLDKRKDILKRRELEQRSWSPCSYPPA